LFFTGLRMAFLSDAGRLANPFAACDAAAMTASARFMAI
jgi:hypothetical protein